MSHALNRDAWNAKSSKVVVEDFEGVRDELLRQPKAEFLNIRLCRWRRGVCLRQHLCVYSRSLGRRGFYWRLRNRSCRPTGRALVARQVQFCGLADGLPDGAEI